MATGDVIKLGTFYLNGTKKARPTKPWRNDQAPDGASSAGDIPSYSDGQTIEIRNTDSNDAYKLQWIEVNDNGKKYLVCDRVLLVSVSWNDLNVQNLIFGKNITIDGQQFKLRVLTGGSNRRNNDYYAGGTPTNNEWDRIITNEAGFSGLPVPSATDLDNSQNSTDFNSSHNQFWNWFYIYSWTQETYTGNSAYRACRGCDSARNWDWVSATYRSSGVGWRPVLEVLNSAPAISGSDTDLGDKSFQFTIDYSVNDDDNDDTLSVVEKVDDTVIRTIDNAVKNEIYTLDLSNVWANLSLGAHTITIVASDGKGGTATRAYTFNKIDDRIKFTLKNPIETSIASKKIVVSGVLTVPNGATLSVKACNNAFDESPTWEDITNAFVNREAYSFANKIKTAEKWGINIQFEILKNNATEQITVDGFGFAFE